MKRIWLISGILLVLLFGCTSLPNITSDTSMIAVPIKKQFKNSNDYFMYYRLYYSEAGVEKSEDERFITIKPGVASFSLQQLKPGQYDIYAIEQIYTHNNKVYNRKEIDKEFESFPGTITIISNCFQIELIKTYNGKFAQHFDLKVTDEDMYQIVKKELIKMKNSDLWKIEY